MGHKFVVVVRLLLLVSVPRIVEGTGAIASFPWVSKAGKGHPLEVLSMAAKNENKLRWFVVLCWSTVSILFVSYTFLTDALYESSLWKASQYATIKYIT